MRRSESGMKSGSATHFSGGKLFHGRQHCGRRREDFPEEHVAYLRSKGIDLPIERKQGKTFRWMANMEPIEHLQCWIRS